MARTAAPKAIVIKAPKLDISGLHAAYEWMPVDRMISFRLAFEWYTANAVPLLYGDPLDADRQRAYDRASKAKNLGDGTTIEQEREHSYTTALRLYEKVWAKRGLPTVDAAIKAPTSTSARVNNIVTVLGCLNSAYPTVKFGITTSADRSFDQGMILIPEAELNRMIPQSPLTTILSEAVTVAKVTSLVTVEGVTQLDGEAFMGNLPKVLDGVAQWASSQGGQMNRAVGAAPKDKPVMAAGGYTTRTVSVASGVSVADLIRKGLVSVPMQLHASYKGSAMTATIISGGQVNFEGKTFDSISAAASAARATKVGMVNGKAPATNGWSFWKFMDGCKEVEISILRDRFSTTATA